MDCSPAPSRSATAQSRTSTGILTAAWAGGTGSAAAANGFIAWAVAQGDGEGVGDVAALAGSEPLDIANFAFNFGNATDGATSGVEASDGAVNLAANLGGNANTTANGPEDMEIFAGQGFGNSAINVIGNRNTVFSGGGFLNNATNLGNPFTFPNGSDNTVTSGPGNLSLAFNGQGIFTEGSCDALCGNTVESVGPLSIAGAADVIQRTSAGTEPGITLATPFNDTGSNTNVLAAGNPNRFTPTTFATGSNNNVLAAGGTQRSLFRPGLNAAFNRLKATSPGGSVLRSVSDRFTTSAKNFSDTVSKVTGGLVGGADAGADSTSSSDE